MKNKIIEQLKPLKNAVSVSELCSLIGNLSPVEIQSVQKILNEMIQNGEIYFTNKGKYILFENCSDLEIGTISINQKGFGFLLLPGDDIHIEKNMLSSAVDGDTVIVEIISRKPKLEGRVLKIIKRNLNNLVGEVKYVHGRAFLILDDKRKITIELDTKSSRLCVEGMIVLANIISEKKTNYYIGCVNKIIGHKDDAGTDILTIAYKHEIYPDFSEKAMKETEAIRTEVVPDDLKGRTDLTEKLIFTIDGEDTKDIDDAISLEKKDNHYILGVHIADVSYYVKDNSKLNEDAMNRGTSSYLADTVIPMLPHKLSNGICSLNEGVVRLTESCVMEIDESGKVISSDIFPSFIKSRKKMNYKAVNDILMRDTVDKGYEPFVSTLKEMNELAHLIRKEREKRGSIDFELDEPEIKCDASGRAVSIERRVREDGEKMIEDFMIVANETVATTIYNMDLPFIYRVHENPSPEKIEEFIKYISLLGYNITGKVKDITPKRMQELLEQFADTPEYDSIASNLLRSMKKAKYQRENVGHFGLASTCYTHFTSPIRRYPDLTVHRLLRTYLFEAKMDNNLLDSLNQKLEEISIISSEREVKAVEAEREVDDMKMAEYMEGHIGEEYTGKISGLTNFGMFVELDNLIEGLIHISTLKDDMYFYNADIMAIVGTNHKKMYRLGNKVKVKVVSANKHNKTIDFELINGETNGNKQQKSKI